MSYPTRSSWGYAHPIRKRFPDETIEKLQAIAWWDWDRKMLEEGFDDMLDVDAFLQKYFTG
jgi:hypothetical protein